MRILLASSEVFPFSKTGGLADMVGALGKALAAAGHQVGVVTPLYRGIRDKFTNIRKMDYYLSVPLGGRSVTGEVWALEEPNRPTIYFLEQREFFDRKSLYQEGGFDYGDNAERFTFFSKAVAHLARYLTWQPEIVHVHDWQAGLVPILIKHQQWHEGWGTAPRTCLSIHNLAYQGLFPREKYALTNLPLDYFNPNGVEFYGILNCLKAAISYSDIISTVSPRYAREITTPEFGCGLDGVLRQRLDTLVGILNGVDYEEWNTTRNPILAAAYSVRDLKGKAENKRALQSELGLPVNDDIPLFGNITRLADQKGVDIQLGALEEMLATNMQFVLLGSGATQFEHAYRALARRFPTKVAVRIGYDHDLSHRIEAGADFFLMPSRFEPCGLNQMYSLRYGTIPIVRVTGGLDDSVIDLGDDLDNANGIKFTEYSARALAKAIRKALVLYENKVLLRHFQKNAMTADFSWERTCKEYVNLYRRIL
ncbi:MAG: glycogen synthase GlgA [Verrucomicrobiota bacterium]